MGRKQRGGANHFQRFGECLRMCKEKMNAKNIYLTNPAFDKIQPRDQGRG